MSSGHPPPPPHQRNQLLRKTAHAFCTALIDPPPPVGLLCAFFTTSPQITEHGPVWASTRLPFLGKTFTGRDGCETYFTVLSEVLAMELPDDAFPGPEGFIVDAEAGNGAGMVSVVGKGHFKSVKTGKGWDEEFIYRLSDFDVRGRIGHWEIWADPLSAWDAVGE